MEVFACVDSAFSSPADQYAACVQFEGSREEKRGREMEYLYRCDLKSLAISLMKVKRYIHRILE